MIAYVRGTVAGVSLTSTVVDVGGVGLQVFCSPGTLSSLRRGQETQLATSFVVREDSMTLFGFLDEDEKQCFELVQTASGVGPKLAQAVMAVMTPDALRRAIADDDVKALTRVPGIGQKGAQRIILELRDRIGAPLDASGAPPTPTGTPGHDQVVQGLVGLGWSVKEAEKALAAVVVELPDVTDVGALLRAALQRLGRA